MPAAAPLDMLSDRTVLSRPSIDLVMCLLDFDLDASSDGNILPRLAAALAACAQLSSLGEKTKKLRILIFFVEVNFMSIDLKYKLYSDFK